MRQPDSAPNGPEPAGSGLTPKQESAALAVARGLSNGEVAKRTGAGERTLKTWRTRPAFRARVSELRGEMTALALGKLTDGLGFAAATLRKLLTAKSENVRLRAAETLIGTATKLRESTELEAEVQVLRQQVAELASHRGRVHR